MTVISTVITQYCTVHASDSLITKRKGKTYEPDEWEHSKIIPVPHWRGAMSYWGLAKYPAYNWSTVDWLRGQIKRAGQESAEEFAQKITANLTEAISKMNFPRSVDSGIGIHFTAYEYIDNCWIPELFLISNWSDTNYKSLRPTGIGFSRETYHTITKVPPSPEHRNLQYRLKVHKYFHKPGNIVVYNNGDPCMFNAAAHAIFDLFRVLNARGKLNNPQQIETYLAMARRPIEIISSAQRDFGNEGTRIVGGKPHDLAITPRGEYHSTTRDDKAC